MGKSYRNNDEYSKKWAGNRKRDHKKNKFKNNGQKNNLTSDVKRSSLSVEDGVSEY
jgi:hypothetical protein